MGKRLVIVAALALAAPGSALAGAEREVDFMRQVLAILQPASILENREYCGFIGYRDDGTLAVTPPEVGTSHRCTSTWPEDMEVVASYHTHSAYDPDSWSEIPSATDIEGDEAFGIDGYISTPGGRFWFVDTTDMVVSQLCGIGCLPSDPQFDPTVDGKIRKSYTYEELLKKLDE